MSYLNSNFNEKLLGGKFILLMTVINLFIILLITILFNSSNLISNGFCR